MASVIVPVYNGDATLARCLGALTRQTVQEGWEVVVVDDGSTDRSAAVAQEFGATVITHSVRRGAAAARNSGAGRACGEILLFIDADCEASPGWIEAMLKPLADEMTCAVYGAYRSQQKQLVARFAQAEFDERYARLARCERVDFLSTHAAAIRRSVFEEVGGFHPDLRGNEDVDLAYRLSRRGYTIVFAPQATVYHHHRKTLRSYLRTKVSRGYWRTVVYARHPGKAIDDAYTPPWLKLQATGLAFEAVMLATVVVWPQLLPLLLLLTAGLILTTLPFTRFVLRTQPALALVAPWLSLARSGALALGVVGGMLAVGLGWLRQVSDRRGR